MGRRQRVPGSTRAGAESGAQPSRLLRRAAFGALRLPRPAEPSIWWTSAVTGQPATRHGILSGIEPAADQSRFQSTGRASRNVAAIWEMLDAAGLRTITAGWPASHPAAGAAGFFSRIVIRSPARFIRLKGLAPWRSCGFSLTKSRRPSRLTSMRSTSTRRLPGSSNRKTGMRRWFATRPRQRIPALWHSLSMIRRWRASWNWRVRTVRSF